MKNFKAGIDKVYKSLVTESEVPDVTSDDFVMFLQWMAKRTNEEGDALYTPLNIADVVAEPHHYSKEFTEYQAWRESEFGNSILHPNKGAVDEDRHTDSEDIIRGTLQIKGDRMDIGIHDATITVHGVDSPNPMARIRAYLEMALAHILGYSVDAPGTKEGSQFKPLQQPEHTGENPPKVGDYKVSVLWAKNTGYDSDQFKLTPKSVNAAFAYQYSRQPAAVR